MRFEKSQTHDGQKRPQLGVEDFKTFDRTQTETPKSFQIEREKPGSQRRYYSVSKREA